MNGILNINKATGMTSHDVVANIRSCLKQKRVGHAGTLDPAASGVLPICIGQATRVAEYLSESGKAYQAEIVFGVVTDTYDSEGTVVRTASVAHLNTGEMKHAPPQIVEALQHFIGSQKQTPPLYSAIKLQGQPAYKLARAGREITLEPRTISIYQLEVVAWLPPRLTVAVECSKGTYIRSLAYDLGERLGCGAHLGALVRTRSGPFSLSESITLEQLSDAGTEVAQFLYPADVALQQHPALVLDEATVERVLHGNTFTCDEQAGAGREAGQLARVYNTAGHFLAIAEWDAERDVWQPKKVLA